MISLFITFKSSVTFSTIETGQGGKGKGAMGSIFFSAYPFIEIVQNRYFQCIDDPPVEWFNS
jgi:hypothetical protein